MITAAAPLSISSREYAEASDFLLLEAEMLDDLREREWLETMVSHDVVYQLPLRENRGASAGPRLRSGHLPP
ncbi:hypothetical protein [Rhodococcus pyridinivorans]|uniref:hypothetical protein n=1 Tax=Rhodococcus pyridinivorans TaxID=103816 RepID=UPI003AAF5D30